MPGRFLPGVTGPQIEAILNADPGREIESGKFDSPRSSAALAVNAFRFFLNRATRSRLSRPETARLLGRKPRPTRGKRSRLSRGRSRGTT